MKKFSIILALVMAVTACLAVAAGCQNTASAASSYVAMDINPSVEFVLDKDNKVVSVRAMNEDAQIMLYGAEGIIGATVENASKKIAELAVTYKYVSEANNTISVTVSGKNAETENKIFEEINTSFVAELDKNGIAATLTNAGGILLNRELEKVKAQYPDNAAVQSLTVGKYRLIKSAMAVDHSLTIETAAAMEVEDITEIVHEAHEYYKDMVSDTYERVYEEAEIAYEAAKSALLDTAYLTVAPIKGAEYIALKTAYFALEKIDEIDSEIEAGLSEADVEILAGKLQMTAEETEKFLTEVKDGSGKITEDQIEYYLERLMRNMTEDEEEAFEELLDDAEDFLDELEDKAETVSTQVAEKINGIVAALKAVGYEIDAVVSEYDDIEDILDLVEEEIEKVEKWFEENLTKEEKKQVKDIQNSLNDKVKEAEEAFKSVVKKAKDEAKAVIEEARQTRISININEG